MAKPSRRVVIITGASAGVGRATARAFAARGDDVCLIARGRAGLEAARAEAAQAGVRAIAVEADVADAQAMLDAADRAESELGPIDVWVNAAMASMFAPFWETPHADFQRVTDVTYHGVVNGTRAALRHMRPRDHGTIVQIGSVVVYRGVPLQPAYSGAKVAVEGFTDSVRVELLHEGSNVRLTVAQMPALNTPYYGWARNRMEHEAQPPPPVYEPELAADAIVWAADHAPRELLVTSSVVGGMLGQRIAPSVADRFASVLWGIQQRDTPRDPAEPDNLYVPLDEETDFGAHGAFGDQARRHSAYFWFRKHQAPATALAAAVLAGAAALWSRRR